jgi:citrate lyase beta subunit
MCAGLKACTTPMPKTATERSPRQPVHTVYGGAQLFAPDTAAKLGAIALRTLREYAPDAATLATAIGLRPDLAERIYPRIVDKLEREPVEDYRIDFEDGFGSRSDAEEDAAARTAASHAVSALKDGTLPRGIGIRIKNLGETKRRGLRTFELFLSTLLDGTGGTLPPDFVVTLPKITASEQVSALAAACEEFESKFQLAPGTLRFELMVETPESIFSRDGRVALPELVARGNNRVTAAHFGTYDYTASLGITAAHQHMLHPVCDFAKHVMQLALAGTGVWLSDGATNVMPVAPHRAPPGGTLTTAQRAANTTAIHSAWELHAAHVRHSLVGGFFQGWDLHPAQLPTRYAAVFSFFIDGLEDASARLNALIQAAAPATPDSSVFDDPATGQALLNYFLRAINCGAITEREAGDATGLSSAELRTRSFAKIMAGRRTAAG